MSRTPITVLLSAGTLALTGCGVHRDLTVSEVGVNAVELLLAEQSGNQLNLDGHRLRFANSNGASGEIPLTGTIRGGRYLIVFTEPGYAGPPVIQSFVNHRGSSIDGIKVAETFFPPDPALPNAAFAWAFHVRGEGPTRYIFPFFFFHDVTDRYVRFGPTPRPPVASSFAFAEDGSLNGARRTPRPSSLLRATTVSIRSNRDSSNVPISPMSGRSESEWTQANESFGELTP